MFCGFTVSGMYISVSVPDLEVYSACSARPFGGKQLIC